MPANPPAESETALAVISLLVFGVFNVSFNLLESGIVTFTEHPVRAYLWAALLPVGALGVKVGRFWNLFLKVQGARLAILTGDLPTLFNAMRRPPASGEIRMDSDALDPAQTKIEMLRASRNVEVTDWITRDLPADHRAPPPTVTMGPMKIGIRWKGDRDLDLYARARGDSEVLFFQHTRVPEGYYYKDHRSSPDREYEFIEFTEPVDIRQVRASVNFYEGTAPGGMSGEVRIEFQGRIYTSRFRMSSDHGNEGREGRQECRYRDTINILEVLGYSEGVAGESPTVIRSSPVAGR